MYKLIFILILALIYSCSNPSKKKDNTAEKAEEQNIKKETPIVDENKTPSAELKNEFRSEESEMIYFEGGTFLMGSETGLQQEMPVHEVTVQPFSIDKNLVTIAQFGKFVAATNYKTEAEKFGDSGVFNLDGQNWELLPGAFWKKPFGPSGPDAEQDHPVTHVSWNDAVAYSKWAGKRLTTEAEWEYAARSGKNSENKFSWGNEVTINGKYFANTWQGTLQAPETGDGFLYTSPVGIFGENEAGLNDMGGNVWQWCSDTYRAYPGSTFPVPEDPNVKVIRGGSFFFDQYGENSFSVSGRSMNSVETSLFNTGFRCAKDGKDE